MSVFCKVIAGLDLGASLASITFLDLELASDSIDSSVWYEVNGKRFGLSGEYLQKIEKVFDFADGWRATAFVCPFTNVRVTLTSINKIVDGAPSHQLLADLEIKGLICDFFREKLHSEISIEREEAVVIATENESVEAVPLVNFADSRPHYLESLGILTQADLGELVDYPDVTEEAYSKIQLKNMFPELVDIILACIVHLAAEDNPNLMFIPSSSFSAVDLSNCELTQLPAVLSEFPGLAKSIFTLNISNNPELKFSSQTLPFRNLATLNVSNTAPVGSRFLDVVQVLEGLRHFIAIGKFVGLLGQMGGIYDNLKLRSGSFLCGIDLTVFSHNLDEDVFRWLLGFAGKLDVRLTDQAEPYMREIKRIHNQTKS